MAKISFQFILVCILGVRSQIDFSRVPEKFIHKQCLKQGAIHFISDDQSRCGYITCDDDYDYYDDFDDDDHDLDCVGLGCPMTIKGGEAGSTVYIHIYEIDHSFNDDGIITDRWGRKSWSSKNFNGSSESLYFHKKTTFIIGYEVFKPSKQPPPLDSWNHSECWTRSEVHKPNLVALIAGVTVGIFSFVAIVGVVVVVMVKKRPGVPPTVQSSDLGAYVNWSSPQESQMSGHSEEGEYEEIQPDLPPQDSRTYEMLRPALPSQEARTYEKFKV